MFRPGRRSHGASIAQGYGQDLAPSHRACKRGCVNDVAWVMRRTARYQPLVLFRLALRFPLGLAAGGFFFALLQLFLLLLVLGAIAVGALLEVVGLHRHGRSPETGMQKPSGGAGDSASRFGIDRDQTFFRFSAELLPRFGSRCSS